MAGTVLSVVPPSELSWQARTCFFEGPRKLTTNHPRVDKAGERVRRDDLTGRSVHALVTFSETDASAPRMRLTIQAYDPEKGSRPNASNCAIPREHIPTWDSLVQWAGDQILFEDKTPFLKAVETFIMTYSGRGNEGSQLPKVRLMKSPSPLFSSLSSFSRILTARVVWSRKSCAPAHLHVQDLDDPTLKLGSQQRHLLLQASQERHGSSAFCRP